jgi:hypothetical protein
MTDNIAPESPSQAVEISADVDAELQQALLQTLLMTVNHFFGGFPHLFQSVTDPRNPMLITYPLPMVLATGVLMFLMRLGARRQVHHWLRGNGPSVTKFEALFDIANCPHGDTLDYAYSRLDVAEVQAVVTGMVDTLIRQKVLYPHRLLERYFLVALDGTGVLTFPERHCAQCLTRTHQGHTTYYHPVLEAKLVTASGWAFSLLTEFIENPGEHPTKQDCELKAFYRLAARLKARFPRLPLCLLLDGLFAGGPTFALCTQYTWKYLVVLQEADLPSVQEEFRALTPLSPENQLHLRQGGAFKLAQAFRWVNDISYSDAERREHTVAVLECLETKQAPEAAPETTRYKWITNFTVTAKTVAPLANEGGRLRWKIENEGFNIQKNGGYGLTHRYSQDATASKIFYLLLQIAHLLAQLIEAGSLLRAACPAGVGSARNLALRLLEAWRNLRLSVTALRALLVGRIQIRFNTS